MTGLVEAIAKSLVSKPDEVVVIKEGTDDNMVIKLKVAKEDMGKVIGRQGRIAKAIRTVIKAAAIRQNVRVSVDILEEEDETLTE